ncbi:MAG: hypothetical protein IJY59_09560 [Bacteroidaceae bacterium]|nr:hypothetical protein [Bacteroidaceae bacterium]
MKLKVLNIFACLFIAACSITSCLDDETVEYDFSQNASITAFAITDSIVTYYPSITASGKDTTLSTAVLGTDYPFIIDQLNHRIYNADSLPVGTDISKVVVSISSDGYYVFRVKGDKDTIFVETDSLDFTNPIKFKVLSQMGVFGHTYTAELLVHKQEPELLNWTRMNNNFSTAIQAQKAVYLNKTIYVFAEQEAQTAVTYSTNGKEWSELQDIDIPVKADYSTAMVWNDQLYILANNELYCSENGINWTKVETEQTFNSLITCNSSKMIGADADNYYIESTDGITWGRQALLPESFPQSPYQFASYSLLTNSAIERTVLMGYNANEEDTTNIIWSQLSNETEWSAMTYENNKKLCPKFENPTIIRYNDALYAFGGPAVDGGEVDAFSCFYSSTDNGISWEAMTENMLFPEEFTNLYEQAEGNYSCIVDKNKFIWVIWSKTGEIWRGRINKLGFKKQ